MPRPIEAVAQVIGVARLIFGDRHASRKLDRTGLRQPPDGSTETCRPSLGCKIPMADAAVHPSELFADDANMMHAISQPEPAANLWPKSLMPNPITAATVFEFKKDSALHHAGAATHASPLAILSSASAIRRLEPISFLPSMPAGIRLLSMSLYAVLYGNPR
jgi:hypothetical protein